MIHILAHALTTRLHFRTVYIVRCSGKMQTGG